MISFNLDTNFNTPPRNVKKPAVADTVLILLGLF